MAIVVDPYAARAEAALAPVGRGVAHQRRSLGIGTGCYTAGISGTDYCQVPKSTGIVVFLA